MSEQLDEYPDAFQGTDKMPWETSEADQVTWIDGSPLGDFPSSVLLSHRKLLVKKQGKGSYFQDMIDAIDTILTERGGE